MLTRTKAVGRAPNSSPAVRMKRNELPQMAANSSRSVRSRAFM